MEGQHKLLTEGVSTENVTCELHNSQATNAPSACDCTQSHLDAIEYHDDIMITPKENKSSITNCSENIYFRVDAMEARLGKMNSSSPNNTQHNNSESTALLIKLSTLLTR